MGKRSKIWLKTRKEFLEENRPDHAGFFCCGICGLPVHYTDMEVDHVEGRLGERLVDKKNLQATHVLCNRLKGSKKVAPKVSETEKELRRTLDL